MAYINRQVRYGLALSVYALSELCQASADVLWYVAQWLAPDEQ